jgi:hypothetical protein
MYHNYNPPFPYTTQADLRDAFWDTHEGVYKRKGKQKQNAYSCEVRTAWNDFVDMMQKSNQISEALAFRATL